MGADVVGAADAGAGGGDSGIAGSKANSWTGCAIHSGADAGAGADGGGVGSLLGWPVAPAGARSSVTAQPVDAGSDTASSNLLVSACNALRDASSLLDDNQFRIFGVKVGYLSSVVKLTPSTAWFHNHCHNETVMTTIC